MAEIELHQLQRPYQRLRIVTQANTSRLVASLCAEGQQTPVLIIEPEAGRYLLIDGYQRVAALETLGRDTVDALVLPFDEASALIFSHRQQRSARRSAIEDAWLLRELVEQHGLGQRDLTQRLGHGTSWVSRRLGLVTALPESVQELVRTGRLPSYSAMKYLVPLARANDAECEQLAARLAGHSITTRQMERLYVAWRSSDDEGRARLVDQPLLFLRAAEEMERSEPPRPDAALIKEIEVLGAISRRVARRLSRRRRDLELPAELRDTWAATHPSLNALVGIIKERQG